MMYEPFGEDLYLAHYPDGSGRCRIEQVQADGTIKVSKDYASWDEAFEDKCADEMYWIN
jgi:hypothetical protein